MNAESAVLGPTTLVRSRLADLMLAAAPHAPCLLSAPTGFGRTTALRQAAARAGPESAQLVSVAADDPGAWVRLRRRLEDARGEGRIRYVLVDCDGVASSSEAEEARAALIEDVAIWSGLIMSSQESLDEVTLRFPGSILLDRSDLAFTDEEAHAVLKLLAPGSPQAPEVARIIDLSEGWVAPLVLAASRLRRVSEGPARTEAVARWLGQHGAEVAVAPWWRSLTSAQQAFLRETAMLDRLDAPACDVVRDADDSQQLLRSITRSEGLLCRDVTTDATPRWRRHRLLTAALASRGGGGSRSERLEAHQRVAEHYVERGEVESAIFHLIEAGRYQEAGEQLRDVEVHLITTGQAELALTWYSDLPPTTWASSTEHELRIGWASLWGGDTTMVRQCLARLEAWLVSSIAAEMEAAQRAAVRGEVQLLSACLAGAMADTAGMIAAARSAVAAFGDDYTANSHQLAPVVVARGLLWEGRTEEAAAELARLRVGDMPNDMIREVSFRAVRAGAAARQGHMHEAAADLEGARRFLESRGATTTALSHLTLVVAQAGVLLEQGELAQARDLLLRAEAVASGRASTGGLTHARLQRCAVDVRAGQIDSAFDILHRTRAQLRAVNPESGLWPEVNRAHARTLLVAGDAESAEAVIRQLPPSADRTLLAAWSFLERRPTQVARALGALSTGQPRSALERRILLAQASSLAAASQDDAAHVRGAVEIARRHGLAGVFAEHPGFRQLAVDQGVVLPAATSARDGAERPGEDGDPLSLRPLAAPRDPDGPRLSPGEVELLARLPSRATQAQMAAELGVSTNTIKTRLRRLYRKLDVSGRDEAIAAAARWRKTPGVEHRS